MGASFRYVHILEDHDTAAEELDVPGRVPMFGFSDDQSINFELGEELLTGVPFYSVNGSGVGCGNSKGTL